MSSNLEFVYGNDILKMYDINVPTLQKWVLDGLNLYNSNHLKQSLGPNNSFFWKTPIIGHYSDLLARHYGSETYHAGYQEHGIRVEYYYFKLSEVEEFTREREIFRKDIPQKESTEDKRICQKQAKELKDKNPDWEKSKFIETLRITQPGCCYSGGQLSKWLSEANLQFKPGRPRKREK